MITRRLGRVASIAALMVAAPLAASAQTAPQTPPPSTPPPAATTPAPQSTQPRSTIETTPTKPSAARPAQANDLVGLAIFSSDGSKLGSVHSIATGPDGKVTAIRFKSGGFLGLGAKLVAVPDGKFTRTGDHIQLGLTSDEVSKLPEVKEQS